MAHTCTCGHYRQAWFYLYIHVHVHCTSPYSPSIQMSADLPSGSVMESKVVGSWGRITSIMSSNLRSISEVEMASNTSYTCTFTCLLHTHNCTAYMHVHVHARYRYCNGNEMLTFFGPYCTIHVHVHVLTDVQRISSTCITDLNF